LFAADSHYPHLHSFPTRRSSDLAPVTHIMDVQVKMIAPEKWRHDERFARAEHIPSSSLALSLRNDPVLHSDTACAGIGPACDVRSEERRVGKECGGRRAAYR